MNQQSITVEAVFQDGMLRPIQPLPLKSKQKVTVTIQWTSAEDPWPEDTEEIYRELAEEDRRLAESMRPIVKRTWPKERN